MPSAATDVSETMEPELRNGVRQFEEAKRVAQDLAGQLDGHQLEWRPAPNKWSVAECLEHLNVTARRYLPVIDDAIRRGRARGLTGKGPFRHGFLMNWIIRSLEPPVRMRLKVPKAYAPAPHLPERVLERFLENQDELIDRVRGANGLDLSRVRLTSPAARWMRMSLGQSFGLVATHQRRHLWQARRVVDSM